MTCFLLKIIDTIEPVVLQCDSPESRLELARGQRLLDPEKNDALFKIDVQNGIPKVSTFSGGELDNEEDA